MGTIFHEILQNTVLVCGAAGWAVAQVIKMVIYAVVHREICWERMVGDGGMPSGHSATVSAMATSSAVIYGFQSFEFAVTCMIAIIVMHDATGVRRETGKQGKVLNEIVEFFQTEGLAAFQKSDKMYEFWDAGLKELVGHSPLQVAVGCVIGIATACLIVL